MCSYPYSTALPRIQQRRLFEIPDGFCGSTRLLRLHSAFIIQLAIYLRPIKLSLHVENDARGALPPRHILSWGIYTGILRLLNGKILPTFQILIFKLLPGVSLSQPGNRVFLFIFERTDFSWQFSGVFYSNKDFELYSCIGTSELIYQKKCSFLFIFAFFNKTSLNRFQRLANTKAIMFFLTVFFI